MRKIGWLLMIVILGSIIAGKSLSWFSHRRCLERIDCEPYAFHGGKYNGGGSVKQICKCARWENE
jgi:hypothetical protein